MRIPARFLRLSSTHGGAPSTDGWLEIDVRALDLDGVTKLLVNLDDVALVRERRDEAAAGVDVWDKLLGKRDEDADDPPA